MDHIDSIAEEVEGAYDIREPGLETARSPVAETIAAFAHEIRTPLTTMNAVLEVLSCDPLPGTDDLRQMIARLQRGVGWINNLVDDLSEWTTICDGTLSFDLSQTLVREWIEQAMELVQPILERREQRLLLACPNPAPIVLGDAFRLSQVMVNLLTNASRYGAWGDTIPITVIDRGEMVTILVSDHGPGIPAHESEIIFAPRVRGSRSTFHADDGQGLGLHIVAGIIERHGGTVGVDSVLGRGTTFWIHLPAQQKY